MTEKQEAIFETTEHNKLHAVREKSQAIGEFIEEFLAEKGITLAIRHEHNEFCREPGGYLMCGYRGGELIPASMPLRRLLAEFFGIDEEKLEAEKRAMLASLREGAAEG